ncbi:hypothetical protein LY78DRAFT_658599 [Colletotrichum sublineola]|nr:hypothetical protein LY78DRAFT_658599 [Colletotrichum sublineola]
MNSLSPSKAVAPLQRSRLLASITHLEDIIRNAENDAEKIETRLAYKRGQIEDLKFDRISQHGPTTIFDRAIKRAKSECEQIYDNLNSKKEEIAVFKDKLKRREAKLASIPPVESADAPSPEDNDEAVALLEITSTQMSEVFNISDDGKTYIYPAMLQGVLIKPINENDEYWEATWIKFNDAVNENQVRREYQQELDAWHKRTQQGIPLAEDEDVEKGFKRYQRNLNQAKVIKKWFSPGSTVHPNQIMAKHHLPDEGLCIAHVLYKICNILERLNALHERGELGMPPLYFLMWRMSVSLDRQPRAHMKTFWRVIIDEDHVAYDNVLRKAEIRGAQHVGDYNFYNRRWKKTVSARGQGQQPLISLSATNTAIHTPEQPATPSRKPRDGQYQSTPATTVKSAASPVSLSTTTLAVKEGPMVRDLQQQRKRQRSSATVEQQTLERGKDIPSSKKARKAAWKQMELALRPPSSTESLASDRPDISPFTNDTEIKNTPPPSEGEKETNAAVAKLPQNVHDQNPNSASGRTTQAWIEYAEEVERRTRPPKIEPSGRDASSYFIPVGQDDNVPGTRKDISELRAEVGESPFPKTGKKVSHGFIFPWYCCEAARRADEIW